MGAGTWLLIKTVNTIEGCYSISGRDPEEYMDYVIKINLQNPDYYRILLRIV